MSDKFDLTPQPKNYSLGNFDLRLDPALVAEIQALSNRPPSPRLRQRLLRPSWHLFNQSHLERMLRYQPPSASAPIVPRGRFEEPLRAADVGIIVKAVWEIPIMQQSVERILQNLSSTMGRSWNQTPLGGKMFIISHTTLIGASTLIPVLNNKRLRTDLLDLVSDTAIPVPFIDGLELQLRHNSQNGDCGATINFDLNPYVQ